MHIAGFFELSHTHSTSQFGLVTHLVPPSLLIGSLYFRVLPSYNSSSFHFIPATLAFLLLSNKLGICSLGPVPRVWNAFCR